MGIVAVGVLLSGFDLFVVNVALGDIAESLGHGDFADLSWVLNAYTITFAALLVPAGRIGDVIGGRTGFLAGLLLFTAASAACGLAPGLGSLVAFRVVQAAGAALMVPASLALVLTAFPPESRGSAVRLWAGLGGVGAALGPVVGGVLVLADWRWIFLVNVPLGLATAVAGWRLLPATPTRRGRRPGLPGAALLTGTLTLLVLLLVSGPEWGWTSTRSLVVAAAVAVGLALNAYAVARSAAPIVSPALLRTPHFSGAAVALLVFHVAFGAMLLSIVVWSQDEWGLSALRTGLGIAPGPALVPVVAVLAGRLVEARGARPVIAAGALVFAAGVASFALLAGPESTYVGSLLPGMLLTGIGVGLFVPPAIALGCSQLPAEHHATGSAVLQTSRQIGIAVGVAGLVAVLTMQPVGPDAFALAWWLTAAVAAAAALTTVARPR